MNTKTRIIILVATVLSVLPMVSHARDYSANTGRFMTMDTYEGVKQDPQSLHKYVYVANNPVNGTDPSGHAAYFVERKFNAWYGDPAWPLNAGHGYLLFTATSDPGGDPFESGYAANGDSFSWHPYSWDFDPNAHGGIGVPGRVWQNHPMDLKPGMLHDALLVTTDPGQQAALRKYVDNWIITANPGLDIGAPKWETTAQKNEIGSDRHIPAPPGGVFYSLYGQNCVWWSTAMLKGSGINVPQEVYSGIRSYNHGAGYARYVISGARSPNTFGVLDLSGLGIY